MLKFIAKKLLMMIPMLLLISFIVYFGLQMTGIDPINFMVSPEMLSANKENVEALRQSLGLNDPLIIQYFRWLGGVLRGDLGYSKSAFPTPLSWPDILWCSPPLSASGSGLFPRCARTA